MGFGWMFLGYMLLLGTNFEIFGVTVDITPDVIGFMLAAHGFSVASQYCDCFRVTKILGNVGIPLSLCYTVAQVVLSMEVIVLAPVAVTVIKYIYAFFKLAFTLSLLYSLCLISMQTGVEKLRKKSVRCAFYTLILFFAEIAMSTILSWFGLSLEASKIASAQMLVNAIVVIVNATLIFGCYMWICLEGDEDMPDNRKHKYKTPFEYFEKANAKDEAAKAVRHHKKKK